MKKLRVCVVFGGRSGEHEVSLVSARSIMGALDRSKYEIIPLGITKSGRWVAGQPALGLFDTDTPQYDHFSMLPADPQEQRLVPIVGDHTGGVSSSFFSEPIDVVFPVLHGCYGEDGTFQGLLDLANLPYVGANVLGSAVCMDKVIQKQLCIQCELPVVDFVWFRLTTDSSAPGSSDATPLSMTPAPQQLLFRDMDHLCAQVLERLRLPVFVKPANAGSSVGISKAKTEKELIQGIEIAAQYDEKIVVEAAVGFVREIEISVLGNLAPKASLPGEVVPSNEFYDYDAKYVDGTSELHIPAVLPQLLTEHMQETALSAFLACGCEGMARVDFLLNAKTNQFFLNELNTIPGFTMISMYPKLWEASGIHYSQLLDELIDLAIERHQRKKRLKTSYEPKAAWFKSSASSGTS